MAKTYENNNFQEIENARLIFRGHYKKLDLVSKIVSFVGIAFIIVGIILAPNLFPQAGFGATILVMIIGLLIMFLPSVVLNKKKQIYLNDYFGAYYRNYNSFVYEKKDTELTLELTKKISAEEMLETKLYKEVYAVPQRNYVRIDDKEFPGLEACDLGIHIKGQKRVEAVFVGKLLKCDNSYTDNDGIIIYLKGKDPKLSLPPTSLESYHRIEDNEIYSIYSNSNDPKRYLKSNLVTALKKVELNKTLIDVSFSIQKGKTYAALGLDDSLMIIPYQNEFKEKPVEEVKEAISQVLKVMKVLSK